MDDFRGVQMQAGDLVTYPTRKGSEMWLKLATIVEIHEGEYVVDVLSSQTQRRTRIQRPDRLAVLGR